MSTLRHLFITSLAILATTLPVHAEGQTGTISVKLDEPLQGRTFEVIQIEDENGNNTSPFSKMGALSAKDVDAAKEAEAYIAGSGEDFSPYTATFRNTGDFTGIAQGVYLVRQTEAPKGYEKIESFLVDIPHTVNGTTLEYEVSCSPKVEMQKPTRKPEETTAPVKKEEKPKEHGFTGLPSDYRPFYAVAVIGAGVALGVIAGVKKKEEDDSEEE